VPASGRSPTPPPPRFPAPSRGCDTARRSPPSQAPDRQRLPAPRVSGPRALAGLCDRLAIAVANRSDGGCADDLVGLPEQSSAASKVCPRSGSASASATRKVAER
jgi:hypothetical protein